MKNRLYRKWVDSFKAPDWMLRKDLFALMLSLPVVYLALITLYTTRKISTLRAFESDVVYIEKLLHSHDKIAQNEPKNSIDHGYVKTVLQELTFLSEDRKQLALICSEVDNKDIYPKVKERLSLLQSGENQLAFNCYEKSDSSIWELTNNVEMNSQDLKHLITLVEGEVLGPFYPNPHRPNLYFSKFKYKQVNKDTTDVFTVDLQLCQKR